VEIVGYLILTRGRKNPLIEYDRKRLTLLLRKTKNMNMGRQLKFKIHVLFYGDNS
jgi:hypothetical protein